MSEQRKGEIEALYAYYAPILDLSVKNKFVLRPEVLAAYQELQFMAQTMAAEKQQRALAYWTQHPEDKRSFYEAQDKVFIAVFRDAEDMAVGYYLRD